MIKKRKYKKKRKNPTFNRSEIDYPYQFGKIKNYVIIIVGYTDLGALSNLLSFLAIAKDKNGFDYSWFSEHCEDCQLGSDFCTCEGSREKSGSPCDECYQNRCICDLDVKTSGKLLDFTASLMKEILNSKELRELSKDIRFAMERTPKSNVKYDNYEYFYKL